MPSKQQTSIALNLAKPDDGFLVGEESQFLPVKMAVMVFAKALQELARKGGVKRHPGSPLWYLHNCPANQPWWPANRPHLRLTFRANPPIDSKVLVDDTIYALSHALEPSPQQPEIPDSDSQYAQWEAFLSGLQSSRKGDLRAGHRVRARLTSNPPPWQPWAMPDPRPEHATKDFLLLSEEQIKAAPDGDRRRSKVERRLNPDKLTAFMLACETRLRVLHDPVVEEIQAMLDELEDDACTTLEGNQQLVKSVNDKLDRYGVILLYEHEVAEASIEATQKSTTIKVSEVKLRCVDPKGSTTAGVFQIVTADKDRAFLGSFPLWPHLIAAPKRSTPAPAGE